MAFLCLSFSRSLALCPGGFSPNFADIAFAIENTNATTSRGFTAAVSTIQAVRAYYGRYVSPSKLRFAITSFGSDVCSIVNPCSGFLDQPTFVASKLNSLVYNSSQTSANVDNLLTNYVFSSLFNQRRNAKAILVILTSTGSNSIFSNTIAIPQSWPLQIYVINIMGSQTITPLAAQLSSNLMTNQLLSSAWAEYPTLSAAFADALLCPGLFNLSFADEIKQDLIIYL